LGWYFYNVLGWWREINIVAYLEGMEISTEILRHLCFQVFHHCNRNSWWLPGPFPSILHSSYCPPTCSWTKAPADYFGRCKLSKCCIINISLWNPKFLTHFNKKISIPPPFSFLFSGCTYPKHCCWGCSCCHSLLGSQWQLKHKLACYLSTVWWFLPESQWSCGGIIHHCCHLRFFDCAVSFRSAKALREKKSKTCSVLSLDLFGVYAVVIIVIVSVLIV
jgi:hypothetical protein